MPRLISYILVRLSIGFALGALVAFTIILLSPNGLDKFGLLELALVLYGLGSIFGLGYLATALAFEATD